MPDGKTADTTPLIMRWLKAFGAFWWDFLVSDTPELLVGVIVIVGIVTLLTKGASLNALAFVGFPVLVVALLGGSLAWARRSH